MTLLLPSLCAATADAYALMVRAGRVAIDGTQRRMPLRHSHHRYTIDGPNGAVTLTVPLVKSTFTMATMMKDIEISNHGNWRHLHWGAIYSSYGKTPYFDYVAPDLQAVILHGSQRFLLDLNMELHNLIVDFMDLPVAATVVTHPGEMPAHCDDLRMAVGAKRQQPLPVAPQPYYQMWTARRGGFEPHLSILDLLMNTGREGLLTLMAMAPASNKP